MGLESPILGNDEVLEEKVLNTKKPGSLKKGVQSLARGVMLATTLSGVALPHDAEAKNTAETEQGTQRSRTETRDEAFDRMKTQSVNSYVEHLINGDPISRRRVGIKIVEEAYTKYSTDKTISQAKYCISVMFDRDEEDISYESQEEYGQSVFNGDYNRVTMENYDRLISSYERKLAIANEIKGDHNSNSDFQFNNYLDTSIKKLTNWLAFAKQFRDLKSSKK